MLFLKKSPGQKPPRKQARAEKNLYPLIHVTNSLKDYQQELAKKEVDSLRELGLISSSFNSVLGETENFQSRLEDFGNHFASISQVSDEFTTVKTEISESVLQAQTEVEDLKNVSQQVETHFGEMGSTFSDLQRDMEKIKQCMSKIISIADQTNILAINASIEAARAGEAGKGFAVVASETSKLAQTSMESVRHIDELIMEIKSLIESVISQAKDSVDNINNSSVLIGNAVKTYDSIFDNIADVSELVEKMIQKINQVENVARNVADISEEQADSSRSILASSDNLVAQADSLMQNSETVAKESENLTTSAKELENQIKIFRV